jgi:hypothetical protein
MKQTRWVVWEVGGGAIVETLRELRDVLVREGYHGQAEMVDRLIQLYDTDLDAFRRRLQSVDLWGGAGAVWEVNPGGPERRRFHELIIRLAEEMQAAGLGTARTQDIADTFRSWLAKGLL